MLKSVFRTTQFKKGLQRTAQEALRPGQAATRHGGAWPKIAICCRPNIAITRWSTTRKDIGKIHIEGNWLLIYRIERDELQLVLTRTGSHDQLY